MHKRRRKTLQSKLLLLIVAAVMGSGLTTFVAFGWTSLATERQRLSDIEQQIRETISSKAEALVVSHAFALRGLVEDNAISDIRQLVGHAVSRDEDVVYGLFVSPEGQPWAYVAPSHTNPHEEAPGLAPIASELELRPDDLAAVGVQRRSLRAFGQDLEEFRVKVIAEDGTPLGNLLYGFGNERTQKAVAGAEKRSAQALARAVWIAGAAGIGSLLLAILWAMRSAARLTAPVAALTANANAIASGQRGVRADIQSGDEVEVLAAAFNQMLIANEEALAKLQATTERALAADRLKSEFLANMSHEIRTPMNGVLGMSKLILTMPIDPKLRRYVSTIDASATALLTILDDVLDFSKMEAGKYTLAPCRFELAPLLQDVLELLASRAHDKDIELVSRIEPGMPRRLVGDPDRFRQILNNLVGNAIKFTEGGDVFLEVTMVSRSETEVLIRVEVTDTGIGIDAADLPKLYQAFSQLDGSLARRHGGTGLGLAISKRLVEMMGGEMQVRSEPGRGSTFGFTAHFAVKCEPSEETAPALPSDLSVLLVEPHRRTGDVLLEALRGAGVAAEHCETGALALSRLRSEPFGIVIMNRDVGDSPAAELAAAIRAEPLAAQPRLILIGRRGVFASEAGDEFCAELLKPVRFSELRDWLSKSGKHPGRVLARERGLGRPRGEMTAPTGVVANGPRVLIIDDNDVNRFVAVEHLQQSGYATDEAVDGRVALDKFMANEYACLLMDCQMPVMDGYAAARAIRKLESELGRERTPIIALTAHALAGERERVLAAGMDDFLAKPFRPSMLESLVRRYWEARPPKDGSAVPTLNAAASTLKAGVEREDLDPGVNRSDKLIRLFLERLPELLAALGRAVDAQNSTELRALSHKLAGSALALGAYRMSETAAGLQRQAELGELAQLPLELQRLQHQHGVLVDLLNAELARRAAPAGAGASRRPRSA